MLRRPRFSPPTPLGRPTARPSMDTFLASAGAGGTVLHPHPTGEAERVAEISRIARDSASMLAANFAGHAASDVRVICEGGLHPRESGRGMGQIIEVGPIQLVNTLLSPGIAAGDPMERHSTDPTMLVDHFMQQNGNNGGKEGSAAIIAKAWGERVLPNPTSDGRIAAHNAEVEVAQMTINAWQIVYTRTDGTLGFRPVLPADTSRPLGFVPTAEEVYNTVMQVVGDHPGMDAGAAFTYPIDTFIARNA